jgi:hypothetical protein
LNYVHRENQGDHERESTNTHSTDTGPTSTVANTNIRDSHCTTEINTSESGKDTSNVDSGNYAGSTRTEPGDTDGDNAKTPAARVQQDYQNKEQRNIQPQATQQGFAHFIDSVSNNHNSVSHSVSQASQLIGVGKHTNHQIVQVNKNDLWEHYNQIKHKIKQLEEQALTETNKKRKRSISYEIKEVKDSVSYQLTIDKKPFFLAKTSVGNTVNDKNSITTILIDPDVKESFVATLEFLKTKNMNSTTVKGDDSFVLNMSLYLVKNGIKVIGLTDEMNALIKIKLAEVKNDTDNQWAGNFADLMEVAGDSLNVDKNKVKTDIKNTEETKNS